MSSLPTKDPISGYLPPGIHRASHEAIRSAYVAPPKHSPPPLFDSGNHRQLLFAGYERLVEAITLTGIGAEQWIGGSFVSHKEEPSDIDLVSVVDAKAFETLSPEIRAMIKRYFQGEATAAHCSCDSYFIPAPPASHQLSDDFQIILDYWKKKLGHDQIGRPKGIISRLVETEQSVITEDASVEPTNATAS